MLCLMLRSVYIILRNVFFIYIWVWTRANNNIIWIVKLSKFRWQVSFNLSHNWIDWCWKHLTQWFTFTSGTSKQSRVSGSPNFTIKVLPDTKSIFCECYSNTYLNGLHTSFLHAGFPHTMTADVLVFLRVNQRVPPATSNQTLLIGHSKT